MRSIGLDVHRDFCEVAIAEAGEVCLAGRVKSKPEQLELFAQSLDKSDQVTLEATGNALAIARIIRPHVAHVVLANPKAVKAAVGSRTKTDRVDAKTLATLLAGGFLPEVWTPDEITRARRSLISRRANLVRQRTREKNQIHAVLQRNLRERVPVSDLFGARGRRWLGQQRLPRDEQDTVDSCLRQIEFLDREVALLEERIAEHVLGSREIKRLMTLPGVSSITATALMAAIGDVSRFPSARHLGEMPWGLHVSVGQVAAVYGTWPRLSSSQPNSRPRPSLVARIRRLWRDTDGPLEALDNAVKIIEAYAGRPH